MLAESKSVFWEPNAWTGSDFAACSPPVCLSVTLSRLQMWRQSAPHRREMAFWSSAEAQLSTCTRRERKKKKSFRKLSVCLWKFNRVCALPIYSPFFSSVLSARNLLRNVPTSPALCTSQGISPTFLFTHYCFFLQTSASRLDFCFTSPGNLMSSVMFLNKYIRLKAYWCMMSLADTKVPVLLREQKLSKIRNVKLSLPVGEVARNKKNWHLLDWLIFFSAFAKTYSSEEYLCEVAKRLMCLTGASPWFATTSPALFLFMWRAQQSISLSRKMKSRRGGFKQRAKYAIFWRSIQWLNNWLRSAASHLTKY